MSQSDLPRSTVGEPLVRRSAALTRNARALLAAATLRFAYLAVLRLLGCMALLARSDLAKDAEILGLAPSGRGAPVPRRHAETVLGRPRDPIRAGPAAPLPAPQPASPDRLTGRAAGSALRCPPWPGLSTPAEQDRPTRPAAGPRARRVGDLRPCLRATPGLFIPVAAYQRTRHLPLLRRYE